MQRKTIVIATAAAAVAAGVAIGGVAVAATADDNEAPITGEAYDRATAAALDHVGEAATAHRQVQDAPTRFGGFLKSGAEQADEPALDAARAHTLGARVPEGHQERTVGGDRMPVVLIPRRRERLD